MAKMVKLIIAASCFAVLTAPAFAQGDDSAYAAWLAQLENDALHQGITEKTVHTALDNVTPNERVIELDQKQPEGTTTFENYQKNVVSPKHIEDGKRLRNENAAELEELSHHYGIPPEIIVALWGIESNYGRMMGNFSVIESLTTLAYEGRRANFFRGELFAALRILDEEHMSPEALRGSWAGAMGQSQFMPSTYLKHAVDQDGDGKRDIWGDTTDVLGSIAAYLSSEGWNAEQPWGFEVELNKSIDSSEVGVTKQRSMAEWKQLGVNVPSEVLAVNSDVLMSLIQPDGADGRSFLVYDSFRALMKWNRSTYFATAVGLLADRIKQ